MVFEGITDRLRNRNLLKKEPSGDMEDIEPLRSEMTDIPVPPKVEAPVDVSDMEEMTPSDFTRGLKADAKSSSVLKDLSSDKDIESMLSSRDESTRETIDLEPLPIEPQIPKSPISDIPPMPETPLKSDIPPMPESPKVDTKIPETPVETPKMPETETIISDKLPKEEAKTGPSLVDTIKSKFKTGAQLTKNLGENLAGPAMTDRDYALRGDYKGIYTKEELNDRITALKSKREQILSDIKDIDKEILEKRQEAKDIADKLRGTKDIAERAQFNSELKRINDELKRIEDKRKEHVKSANDHEQSILDYTRQVNEYDMAIRRGRMKASTGARIGKKLQALGESSEIVSSGVYGGKSFGKGDWFGPKGFLAQPYKQANITSSVVQPVKTKLSNLNAYTRMTGQGVGIGMADALTTVQANKNVAPLGVPGTISGARRQFEYNIPAKRILPGDVTANINRDILPSIFAPAVKPYPVVVSPMNYQQVVQPDGTVVNVPVQQRKHKQFSISVNRFAKDRTILKGPRVTVNPIGSRLDRGINSVGTLKPMDIDIGGRKNFELGLITVKKMHINGTLNNHESGELHKELRKSKKSKPMVDLDSAKVISRNINKLMSKKKKSK